MADRALERILVTGGSGFIGRYVVDLLTADGSHPIITTFKGTGPYDPKVDAVEVDLTSPTQTQELIKTYSPQIVLHLAGVTGSDKPGDVYHDINFNGTVNLIRALEKTGVTRVIMLGSAAEYGDQPTPFRETMDARPISHYALSKAKANQYALDRYHAIGFPVTILRVFTAYGVGQPDKMFFSQLIRHALLNRRFSMSDGIQKRDFVHVEDVAVAIKSAIYADNSVGRIINIAGGKGIRLRDLAQQVWKICGADDAKLDIGSRIKTGDDNFDTEADISLAAELLNWRPGHSILSESGKSFALAEIIRRMRTAVTTHESG